MLLKFTKVHISYEWLDSYKKLDHVGSNVQLELNLSFDGYRMSEENRMLLKGFIKRKKNLAMKGWLMQSSKYSYIY